MGKTVVMYTFLTTVIAASVALGLFLVVNPSAKNPEVFSASPVIEQGSYFSYILQIISSNIFQPFIFT